MFSVLLVFFIQWTRVCVPVLCQQFMLSKRWLGAVCTQYSELSVTISGEPPPSDTEKIDLLIFCRKFASVENIEK